MLKLGRYPPQKIQSSHLKLILKAMDSGLGNGLFCKAGSFKRFLSDSVKPQKMKRAGIQVSLFVLYQVNTLKSLTKEDIDDWFRSHRKHGNNYKKLSVQVNILWQTKESKSL